jgi:hypothetical protein
MKCLQCDNTVWAGEKLCPACLAVSQGGTKGVEPRSLKIKSLFGLEEAAPDAAGGCIKCGKSAEPGKVLCAECLGKHPSFSKRDRADRYADKGRKKKSRLAQLLSLFLTRYLPDKDAAYIERRSDLLAGAIPGFLAVVLGLFAIVLGYETWQGQYNGIIPSSPATSLKASNKNSPQAPIRKRYRPPGAENPSLRISIVEPRSGSVFKVGESISIATVPAQGSVNPSRVRFSRINSRLCEVSSSPFSCSWESPPLGNHRISAQAFGRAGESGPIAVTVLKVVAEATFERLSVPARQAPIFISNPAEDAQVVLDAYSPSTAVHFNGWVTDAAQIKKISARIGENACSVEGVGTFKGVCAVSTPGSYTITVEAAQLDGATSTSSVAFVAERGVRGSRKGRVNPYYSQEELFEVVQDWGRSDPLWEPNDPAAESIIPEEEQGRIAPIFNNAATAPEVARFAQMARLTESSSAGSFDDYVASSSTTASPPATAWSAPFGRIVIPLQPRFFGFSGTPPIPAPLEQTSIYGLPRFSSRGIAFLSFHENEGGHAPLMGLQDQSAAIERDVYFLGTLPTTAAEGSYADTLTDETSDSFDGLFTHYFALAGEKGRENAAITKLLAAGSFLPYETKRILKLSGNYPAALQWLWRAALPYSDGSGRALPFSHDVRHRVAYLARGDENLPALSAAQPYHRYDEVLHMREMARLAGSLKGVLPPVTMLSLVDYSVSKGQEAIISKATWDESRQRIKLMLPTVARVWAEEGESIQMRIDLSSSYDIFGKELSFTVKPLYPEHQEVVSVSKESSSQFLISVRFDSKFPRSRIPVIATASNGTLEGTPAFINFLWPESQLKGDSLPKPFDPSLPETHVNRNKRPIVSSHTPINLAARVGTTVKIPLSCSDPEGFETTWIRWSKEPGTIENSVYIFPVSAEYAGRTLTLHFICSDGTGGYGGLERTLTIE